MHHLHRSLVKSATRFIDFVLHGDEPSRQAFAESRSRTPLSDDALAAAVDRAVMVVWPREVDVNVTRRMRFSGR